MKTPLRTMRMYPVIDEATTLKQLLGGASIARFGDGELRLALGGRVGHQEHHPLLAQELRHILTEKTKCLVGIPYIDENSPKREVWEKYGIEKYTQLYNPQKQYYSAFITRPDSAPWIDQPIYWESMRQLWKDKDITVVSGSNKGFQVEDLPDAKSIKFIKTLPEQAYAEINCIEREIGTDISRLVILSVGATATVLAWRLAEKGFHALDLGHVSMFMRRRGLLGENC